MKKEYEKLYKLALSTQTQKPFTLARIFRKEYGENFISDWLAFLLDPKTNGAGKKPLNIFMDLCKENRVSDDADVRIYREYAFNKNNRIDLLIQINEDGKTFYIAIENKILSSEGDKQTERYADFLYKNSKFKDFHNICIFLTPTGIAPLSDRFTAISYGDYIENLQQIIEYIDGDKQFYFNDFIEHFNHYILNDNFSADNCNFITACSDGIVEDLKLKKNHTTAELEECYCTAIMLRNRFFDFIEKALIDELEKDQWIIKKSSFYIQIYKPRWKDYNIHYEIIIHKHKGLLHPDCTLLIMLHKEGGKKINNITKSFKRDKNSNFNKPQNVLAEIKIETKKTFNTPDNIEVTIQEIIKGLKDMIDKTCHEIDSHVN